MTNKYKIIGGKCDKVELVIDDNYQHIPSHKDIQKIQENENAIQKMQNKSISTAKHRKRENHTHER